MSEQHPKPSPPPLLILDSTGHQLAFGIAQQKQEQELGLGLGQLQWLAQYASPDTSQRYHSAVLISAIRDCLSSAGLSIHDIQGIVVNRGPGSFTGIRTGLTLVRTLAQFLKVPVYPLNCFELLAQYHKSRSPHHPQAIQVALDALRNRVYTATLGFDSHGPFYLKEPALLALPDYLNTINPNLDLYHSQSLASFFSATETNCHPADLILANPLDLMLNLVSSYGDTLKLSDWQSVTPLYLQQPNITIKLPPGQTA